MLYTSFLYNIFVITVLFMITLSSYSSTLNGPVTLDPMLHQMVKNKDENYATYKSKARPLKPFEVKLDIEEFYNTIFNLEHKRIPEAFGKYNYDDYKDKIINYCENEYVTLERFRRDQRVLIFKTALSSLKDCVDKVFTTDQQRKNLIENLQWLPSKNKKNYGNELVTIATHIRDCLKSEYSNTGDAYKIPNFFNCLITNDFKDDKKSKSYAAHLINDIETTFSDQFSAFEICIETFKGSFNDIFPDEVKQCQTLWGYVIGICENKSELRLKDLYILELIIYHHNSSLDNINMSKLFHYYTDLEEIQITHLDINECKSKVKIMDSTSYTQTKLSYITIPRLLEYNAHALYKTRIIKIIDELSNIDNTNEEFYTTLKSAIENMTEDNFKRLIQRRALKNEDYNVYAMRMNIREYLPLPKSVWSKELEIIHTDDAQKSIYQELYQDFLDLNGKLLHKIKNSTQRQVIH